MKRLSKVLGALLLNLLMVSSAFASTGIMAGEGNVKMVQTKWFDIIYGDVAEESASVMYANADQIYQDLADMYGWTEPPCRMPVVLTTQVEVFNAYFSTGNYNHIVLYVTNPIDELANQPDSLLWTFRHELTHAYTYNMKSKMTKLWCSVFGDSSTFHTLTVTPGVAEGATLTSESYEGNGRLNDEFAKQYVKQAKLEDKFPKYHDVQGSRDIYPSGCFYHFNGAFHEYLQENYGLQKYADFWFNCINNSITTKGAFKKAYGLNLKKEWAKFAESYKVPPIPGDPLAAGSAKDFFTSSNEYSIENKKGAIFAGISASEKGITYIDEKNNTVYFVSKEDLKSGEVSPVSLFQYFYIESATQSVDGKYITVSYYDQKEANYRYHIAIYDTESKKWYTPNYHGVKNGIIVKQDSDYYLTALEFKGENSKLKVTKLITDYTGKITGEGEPVYCDFNRSQIVSNLTPVKDGVFAYIVNNNLNFSINLMKIDGTLLAQYKAPSSKELKHFLMRYLSANLENPDELYFSWVSEGTMARVGKLNLADGEYTLSLEDLSGGIYYPTKYNDDLYYVGNFFEYNKIFKKSSEFNVNDKFIAEFEDFSDSSEDLALFGDESSVVPIPSVGDVAIVNAYNPFRYLRGTFLPISQLYSASYDSLHQGSYALPFGITYSTNNPWDSLRYTLSVGYGNATNSGAVSLAVNGGTDTQLFNWGTSVYSEFDYKGWKAAEVNGQTSFVTDLTNKTVIEVIPSVFFHAGRSNASSDFISTIEQRESSLVMSIFGILPYFGDYGNHDDLFYLFASSQVDMAVGNLRTVLDNRFGRKGMAAGMLPFYKISYDLTNSTLDYSYGDVSFYGKLQFPRIIPIDCEYGKTYNLPVKFVASVFSTTSVYRNFINVPANEINYPSPDLAMVATEVVLYAQEIQKSINFLPFLYFHDVYVSFIGTMGFDYVSHYGESFGIQYAGDFIQEIANGTNKPMAIASLKFSTGLNFLNFGALARSSNKNYFCIMPTFAFPSLNEDPIFRAVVGLDVRF